MSIEVENLDLSQYSIIKPIVCGKYSNFYVIEENQSEHLYSAEISQYKIIKNEEEVNSFFKKNVQVISRLNHPSILKIIGFNYKDFDSTNKPTIITEYFSDRSLTELTSKRKPGQSYIKWNDTEKIICIYGIASAMAFLHKNNVVHGDLNPESILINENCHPKIIYSTILKNINEQNRYRDEFDDMSTCVLSGLIDINSSPKEDDVYAFSLILYLILNGHQLNVKQNKPSKFRRNVSQAYRKLFKECHSPDPEKRPTFEEITISLRNNVKFITQKVDSKKFHEYADSLNNDGNITPTRKSSEKNQNQKSDEINHMSDEASFISDEISHESGDIGFISDEASYLSDGTSYLSDGINYLSDGINYASDGINYTSDNDDDDDLIEQIQKNPSICKICQKEMKNKTDIFYYRGIPYHTNCIKCRICQKPLISIKSGKNKEEEDENPYDDLVCVVPGLFFCKNHFKEYKNQRKPLPREIQIEYVNKMIKNEIDKLFGPYEDDVNAFPLNKNFKLFVPSVTFHFTNSPSQIDFKVLVEKIPKDMIIVNIERGSTFLTIAFIASNQAPRTERQFWDIINPLRSFFNDAIGMSIIGNISNEPVFEFINFESIKSFFNRSSINLLHLEDALNEIDFGLIVKEVRQRLKKKLRKTNWEYIFANRDLYDKAEEAVRKEIENNEIDLIVTGITIFANRNYESFKKIENELPNKVVLYLYHGARIQHQSSIALNNFLLPSQRKERKDIILTDDEPLFGNGIYATENIFYALMYSSMNHEQYLEINEENSVICSKTIYNNKFLAYLNNLKNSPFYNEGTNFIGKDFNQEIVKNKGIHQIFVQSATNFQPIGINGKTLKRKRTLQPSYVTANEYVFPNSEQILPVFSISIKRPEYFILWLNENDYKNSECYLMKLRYLAEVNIYYKQTIDEAINLVNRKIRNKLKFIITVDKKDACRDFINRIRGCHKTNFICMIFSENSDLIELTSKMENVIFTNDFDDLDQFTKIPLTKERIIQFCDDLKSKHGMELTLNIDQLKAFHPNIWI